MKWKGKKEELIDFIFKEDKSYVEIGQYYGVSGNAVKKAALRLGIELPSREKGSLKEKIKPSISHCPNCGKEVRLYASRKNTYCSIKCQKEWETNLKYKEYIQNPDSYNNRTNMRWVKRHILKEQGFKCAICGMSDTWNNKNIVFILDHIDGHANNNNRANLRLICPNCDSQLDTYKSKNKRSDRKYYHFYHR